MPTSRRRPAPRAPREKRPRAQIVEFVADEALLDAMAEALANAIADQMAAETIAELERDLP